MLQKHCKVFLHAWTGNPENGVKFVRDRYPSAEISTLDHRELRESGWSGQLRTLIGLKGDAIIFYFRSLADMKEPEIFVGLHLIHRCKETILADEGGNVVAISMRECLRRLPGLIVALTADAAVFATTWFLFQRIQRQIVGNHSHPKPSSSTDFAYIYPYPLNREFAGGATTHLCGFLDGVAENEGTCLILSGCKFPFPLPFSVLEIPARRKRFVFSESLILSDNWRFTREARKLLAGSKPGAVYQRHGRFMVAGVLLARALRIPLVLEYNGSEVWMAGHWDPARFLPWLRAAEKIAIFGAETIVTVSDALKQELVEVGVPSDRILVNPNGVDPSKFQPNESARREFRRRLGIEPDEVVVAFAGTFSYWHGVEVLQNAIRSLIDEVGHELRPERPRCKLRFLLIGTGPLQAEMAMALSQYEQQGTVKFTGSVPHHDMPGYLNASDILVSPHIPMPDGRPFIGSPTKLFEYMAIGKAIVASRLDQIELVLEHNRTALLVPPGDSEELASAILAAAESESLRDRLGVSAREAALQKYTWKRNAFETMKAAGLRHLDVDAVTPASTGGR
jgi:glycosyltransferase involved in cell wall biosynthesis